MKSQRGITLVSLVMYVIVMIIVLGVMSSIINNFYQNTDSIQADTKEILEFNKFNTYFLKEVKLDENSVDNINEKEYILFASGNSFSFNNNKIYYNDTVICKGVNSFEIEARKRDETGEIYDVVHVKLTFENFEKEMNYRIEEIY